MLKGGSMDDIDPTLNNEVEETTVETPSVEEPNTGEVETSDEESNSTEIEETQEETTEPDESPKKGAQSRIRELNAKAKRSEERAKSLEQQIAELTGSVEPQSPGAPYTPQIPDNGEVSPEQYKQDVLNTAESMVNLRIKQSEAINRINNESNQVIHLYPQLNPDSDQFDSELSKDVTEQVLELVKASPYTASPKKIVERMMRSQQKAVTKEVGKVSENLAKQVSQSATRPTSVSSSGKKSYEDKSIQELEAELGVVN